MTARALLVLLFAAALLVACSKAGDATAPEPSATPKSTPTPEATRELSPSPTPEPTEETQISTPETSPAISPEAESQATEMMMNAFNFLLSGQGDATALIRGMGDSGDTSFVPVLVDLLWFFGAVRQDAVPEMKLALEKLTGEGAAQVSYAGLIEWLGDHPEVQPPEGYAALKSLQYRFIDPNIPLFFYTGVKARISLAEIIWGGVPKDGIPDLIDPPVVTPEEAVYLSQEERVFGVSINGEHRAYPLRIMNAHEMANDILGGEPIALAY